MFSLTIRRNGAEDVVIVDGREFDRSQMTKAERRKLTRMISRAYAMEKERHTSV